MSINHTHFAFVEGACSPARFEPELSLNLEICEMINKKQGTAYCILFNIYKKKNSTPKEKTVYTHNRLLIGQEKLPLLL